jgi:ribonuclease HI
MRTQAIDAIHETVLIFTDGACSGNPGPGGWGVFIRHRNQEWELSGYEAQTTNNRMEMLAVICALQWVKDQAIPAPIILASDSQYVIKGITQWVHTWLRNGWKTSAKKPVENKDLWEKMWHISNGMNDLTWQWVRGHNGHPENERADQLARNAIAKQA